MPLEANKVEARVLILEAHKQAGSLGVSKVASSGGSKVASLGGSKGANLGGASEQCQPGEKVSALLNHDLGCEQCSLEPIWLSHN